MCDPGNTKGTFNIIDAILDKNKQNNLGIFLWR